MKSLHFISLGCPKNLVDSEVMLGTLIDAGWTLTDDPAVAAAIVVNTCAFIEDAKKEAIDTILAMSRYKKEGRCSLLAVAGCLPQRYQKEVAGLFPEVDLFVGAGEFPKIAEFIAKRPKGQRVKTGRPKFLYDHTSARWQSTPRYRAYLKIAEGCFHACSFCVIPKIRGTYRSRDPESVVEEARGMLARGVRELTLIGQDTTAYGRDIGTDLPSLLAKLAELPNRKWIRFLYAYPHAFPERLIEVMREHRDICRYLDLPLQHVSDRVLAAMRRKGTGDDIRNLIARLRSELPDITLRTSLIVGFPGETRAEFRELCEFVREARFEHLGVFPYSPEEGTPAARLPKRIARKIAEERRDELMELQRGIAAENQRSLIGKKMIVLVEGPSEETPLLLAARHEGQAPEIDGIVYVNEGNVRTGEFATVEILEAHEYDLVGKVAKKTRDHS
jgi:ribosomal protein S12 methylthiotransferase